MTAETKITEENQNTHAYEETEQLKEKLQLSAPNGDNIISLMPKFAFPLSTGETNIIKGNFTSSRLTETATVDKENLTINKSDTVFHPNRPVPTLDRVTFAARHAIEDKARQLNWVGAAVSEINQVGLGYVIRYQFADIYYSAATGAHEVHGDIRAKYNALGAANGVLGLPTTDETGTPDGIGRFNHFQGGSIYWTANTGAMMVRGAIRDFWASRGWENSSFGYPISDEHRKVVFDPIGKPSEYWSEFQNGAIYSKGSIAAEAVVAEISPQDLTNVVRKVFDKALKDADEELGIEGGINVLNISNWGFGFWASRQRMITYEIHGFRSIPALPDPTFRLELQFLFGLTWENAFTEPIAKTLTIYLNHWSISTSGVGHGELFDGLVEGIPKKFPFPVQSIPAEALLIDILVTAAGGLKFLLEPNVDFPPIGEIRRNLFQSELNNFIES